MQVPTSEPPLTEQLGFSQSEPTSRTSEAKSRFTNFRNALFGAVGLLFLAGVAGIYLWRDAPLNSSTKTLAVLPFKSLVGEQRDAALELGMADALISKLSDGEEITVLPLSVVGRYDKPEQDSIAAGRELDVEAVLDGSLQRSGDRIRVSARLIRVGDGKQMWASQLDEKFTDIFTVQDSISERVATALKIGLANREKRHHTDNIDAYQLYMKGRYHALRLTRSETDKAISYFQQAIELDPNYALPYLGLARAYLPMALTSGVPSWEVMPRAKEAALRALQIDPNISECHAMMGIISFWYDWVGKRLKNTF